MIKISGDTTVKCDECQELCIITQDDFEFNGSLTEESMNDECMGSQTRYDYTYVGTCDNCEHQFTVKIFYWEYPEGAFNDDDYDTDGCSIIDKPSYTIIYE